MGSARVTLALLSCIIISLASLQGSNAQTTPQEYLEAHNAARREVGVGMLKWDDALASYAQQYANQRIRDCFLVHSNGPYGENIAYWWGSEDSFSGADAVKMWVDEKADYDYNSNTCAQGKTCLHYTQVVWRDSARVGCAKVQCYGNMGIFIGCNYDPPGNFNFGRPY